MKRKHSLFPLLVVLFCISYGILTMLVIEQGRTIDNQKSLIRQLFEDSTKLNAMRMQRPAPPKAQHPATKPAPQANTEAQGQIVVTPRDVPTQAPMNGDKTSAKSSQGIGKLHRRAPLHPPKGVAEIGDERRAVFSI